MRKDKAGRKKENRYISGGHEGTDCRDTFKKHLRKATERSFISEGTVLRREKEPAGNCRQGMKEQTVRTY